MNRISSKHVLILRVNVFASMENIIQYYNNIVLYIILYYIILLYYYCIIIVLYCILYCIIVYCILLIWWLRVNAFSLKCISRNIFLPDDVQFISIYHV